MASFSVPCPKTSSLCPASNPTPKQRQKPQHCSVSFQSTSLALLAGFSLRFQGSRQNQYDVFKVSAQLNEVATKKSSNSAAVLEAKSEEPAKEPPAQNTVPDASSISAFMTQVAHIVKLVDSRDIMELQLKQLDCELVIRKKEALQVAAPVVMMQPHSAQAIMPSQFPRAQVSAPVPSPPASAPVLPSPAKPKSSHPPLKCPMAGTFYRCPAPGAPPFVKVGDKVQKGQVVCIIEAMKLMNEIEIYGHRMALWASIFASNALVEFFKDFHPFYDCRWCGTNLGHVALVTGLVKRWCERKTKLKSSWSSNSYNVELF